MPNFMTTESQTYYSSGELLEIFKEQHRLCSPLDPMADPDFILSPKTTIGEMRDAQDLLPWDQYSEFLNQEFKIDISKEDWDKVLNPDDENTLGDLCEFLSKVAKKENVKPIKILGVECLSAALFLTLKRNLKNKGVNITDLKPSTNIEEFLTVYENFSPFLEEVTLTGVKIFEKLEYGQLQTERKYKYWIDKLLPNLVYKRPIKTGDVKTFRQLIEKIIENKN